MDRAERRHRTEQVRARRIRLHRQIDMYCTCRSEESLARWYHFRYQSPLLGEEWAREVWQRDEDRRVVRDGAMRNEYVVEYRDYDYWSLGLFDKWDSQALVFLEGLEEVGLVRFFRGCRRSHHYD